MNEPVPTRLSTTRTAHRAVLVVFALAGITFATWASRLPDIKAVLDLTPGELGVTLLAGSVGALLALPLAGRVADRVGTTGAVLIGTVLGGIGITGIGLGTEVVGSRAVVSAALLATSAGVSLWDVAMNLQAATVERALGRSVMPLYHASFSAGTVLAALLGAALVALDVPVLLHLSLVATFAVGVVLAAVRAFVSDPRSAVGAGEGPARSAWTERRTVLVGVFVLVAAFTEGTANDWIAVAFVEGHGVPAWAGVVAFACFLSAMTLGRVLGTRLLDRYGRVRVLAPMLLVAAVGSLLVVLAPPLPAYLGTLLWGFGVSLGFPVGMSAAADDPARATARMSVVATIGYGAFIAGPPALGFLGDHVGVLRALLLVAVLITLALLTLGSVAEEDESVGRRTALDPTPKESSGR
ncbi:MFS transporter [Marihabitans asiaticum]|uniref:Fucose permease n=1 Tax=Marihabitans asiaticum TaxID=415218 RepID=A0A560W7Z4_9MICO|nr:MFS transporter [Marihabitans asiaticum]TWD13731.1 fucose permease [Marihabitans asiaticum]